MTICRKVSKIRGTSNLYHRILIKLFLRARHTHHLTTASLRKVRPVSITLVHATKFPLLQKMGLRLLSTRTRLKLPSSFSHNQKQLSVWIQNISLYYRICSFLGKSSGKSRHIFEKNKDTNKLPLLNKYKTCIYVFLNMHGIKILLGWYTLAIRVFRHVRISDLHDQTLVNKNKWS